MYSRLFGPVMASGLRAKFGVRTGKRRREEVGFHQVNRLRDLVIAGQTAQLFSGICCRCDGDLTAGAIDDDEWADDAPAARHHYLVGLRCRCDAWMTGEEFFAPAHPGRPRPTPEQIRLWRAKGEGRARKTPRPPTTLDIPRWIAARLARKVNGFHVDWPCPVCERAEEMDVFDALSHYRPLDGAAVYHVVMTCLGCGVRYRTNRTFTDRSHLHTEQEAAG